MRWIYFLFLLLQAILFLRLEYYRLDEPVFVVQEINFEAEQWSLFSPNDSDMEKLELIMKERKLTEKNITLLAEILDSITQYHKNEKNNTLYRMPIKDYIAATRGDSLINVVDAEEIEYIQKIHSIDQFHPDNEEFIGHLNPYFYLYPMLYYTERDFPNKSWIAKLDKSSAVYFMCEDNIKLAVRFERYDKIKPVDKTGKYSKGVVPNKMLYPYAKYNSYLIGVFIFTLLLPVLKKALEILVTKRARIVKNSQIRPAWIGILVTIFCVGLVISAFSIEKDFEYIKRTVAVLGSFIFIFSSAWSVFFVKRASIFDSVQAEKNILLFWEYDDKRWLKMYKKNLNNWEYQNKNLLFFALLLLIVFSHLFYGSTRQIELTTLMIVLGVISIITFGAYKIITNMLTGKQNISKCSLVSREGLIVGSHLYSWIQGSDRLESVYIDEEEEESVICIQYSQLIRRERKYHLRYMLIPEGKLEEAERAVLELSKIAFKTKG